MESLFQIYLDGYQSMTESIKELYIGDDEQENNEETETQRLEENTPDLETIREQNKEKQLGFVKHLMTARKNAKKIYEESLEQLNNEWENGLAKKEYDEAKLLVDIILNDSKSRTDQEEEENLEALADATATMRRIKQEMLKKRINLTNEYAKCVESFDELDKKIEDFWIEKPELLKEEQEQDDVEPEEKSEEEQQTPPVPEPETPPEPEKKTDPKPKTPPAPEPKTPPVPKAEPKTPTAPKTEQKEPETSQPTGEKKDKKFSYAFSVDGINYDGKKVEIGKLLNWYDDNQPTVERIVELCLGDKKDLDNFLENADKLVYTSIIVCDLKKKDGRLVVPAQIKDRLRTYYDIWKNPELQKESDMHIDYDIRKMSILSKKFRNTGIEVDEYDNIINNACALRHCKNASVKKGPFDWMKFKILDIVEKTMHIKRLEAPKKKATIAEQQVPGEKQVPAVKENDAEKAEDVRKAFLNVLNARTEQQGKYLAQKEKAKSREKTKAAPTHGKPSGDGR